ncbi:MAG: histidine--tRNA ligase, partial [Actinomycetota bacterium]|nr:histidine--tRNA ligase [Actinomycetota bacterium]
LCYAGSFFRQERPQKGRYRQFFQVGIEAIGSDDPRVDAEVIEVGHRFLSTARVTPSLLVNSIGHFDESCRMGYLSTLVSWLKEHAEELAPADRERVDVNPLRTFDSKEPSTVEAMEGAPVITDHLCDDCRRHFETVQALLGDLGIEFVIEPKLVRGLDYYTRTAFEFVAGGLGSQNAVGGGGRYDGLSESLGGPPLPGIGFALGVDRILLAQGTRPADERRARSVYVVALGDEATRAALKLATDLRSSGWRAGFDVMGRGMKGQMKEADRSGARWALIVGDEELEAGEVTIKDLVSGEQERVSNRPAELVTALNERDRATVPRVIESERSS